MGGSQWQWLESRDGEAWTSRVSTASVDSSPGITQGFQFADDSRSASFNKLQFAAAKSLRRAIVILAAVNVLMALLTAMGIFWDCYRAKKRRRPSLKISSSFWNVIGPAEIFPFILSCGIIVQGIFFAVLQSAGLKALLILGCVPISQLMLPAFFITSYIQFVFGMETTIRAMWPNNPFPKRPKWVVFVCLAIVIAGLIATYVVTRITLPPNFCFASLLWFIQRWSLGCVIILTGIASALLVGCGITFLQLYRGTGVEATERLTAYRMVYYMAMAVTQNAIMAPFFYSITFGDDGNPTSRRIQFSMAASIVANLSGFSNAGLYIFLRSSRKATGLQGYFEFGRNRARNGFWSWTPSNRTYTRQMELPVSPVRSLHRRLNYYGKENEGTAAEYKIDRAPRSQMAETSTTLDADHMHTPSKPVTIPEAAWTVEDQGRRIQNRKEAYSIFPPKQDTPDNGLDSPIPVVTYTPAAYSMASNTAYPSALIPAPLAVPSLMPMDHRRGSSLGSSATVQIGLRLSNVDRMPQPHRSFSLKETNSVYSARYGASNMPRTDSTMTTGTITFQFGGSMYNGPRDKALPPVPLGTGPTEASAGEDEGITLSPTVYSPLAQKRNSTKSLVDTGPDKIFSREPPVRRFDPEMVEWI